MAGSLPWKSLLVLYVVVVFASLPFAPEVVLALRAKSLLSAFVTGLYAVSVASVVYYIVFDLQASDWLAYVALATLIVLIALLMLGLKIPEERVHFVQYAVLGILCRNALCPARPEPQQARRALFGAFSLATALGVLDELVQWALPSRAFDLRDIALNVGSVALALVFDELVHDRLRLRTRANRGAA